MGSISLTIFYITIRTWWRFYSALTRNQIHRYLSILPTAWHGEICSHIVTRNGVTLKRNIHAIWSLTEKAFEICVPAAFYIMELFLHDTCISRTYALTTNTCHMRWRHGWLITPHFTFYLLWIPVYINGGLPKSGWLGWVIISPNYADPVYGVATICHQVRYLRWGHPSLFHTAMSLLIRYGMFCMRDISYRLIWMKYINMLSVYAQSGTHRPFNWWIIAVFT